MMIVDVVINAALVQYMALAQSQWHAQTTAAARSATARSAGIACLLI